MSPVNRTDIVEALNTFAVLLELRGENPFKVRAYRSGARALETCGGDWAALAAEGRAGEIAGIGEALAAKIGEMHRTGRSGALEALRASVPPGLLEMMRVPGLGAKKVRALHAGLGVDSLAALEAACEAGRVAALDGLGEKTQRNILDGLRNLRTWAGRHLGREAWEASEPILAGLRAIAGVERAERAGSLRRGAETVGGLDFVAAARDPGPVTAWFAERGGVREVIARGETTASVRTADGWQMDLRVVPPEVFAYAWLHVTGSKEHNAALRQRALARGWSLSEWGLAPAGAETAGRPVSVVPAAGEAQVYAALGLAFVPPELREGMGELEAAAAGALPRLIEPEDLRGVFHNHTCASDGRDTLEAMAEAAAAHGWEYFGVADHSKASVQAMGLDEARLAAQAAAVRAYNASVRAPLHVFAGVECDILPDGRLDFDEALLGLLDYVVVSVHSALGQSEDDMTRRIVRAIEHPCTTMLGHPTGRLLLAREPSRVDLARVIDAAAANGVAIELNANPRRLDLDWRWWRQAAAKGVLCCINPDAHAAEQLACVEDGVRTARKGWLAKEHVLNALPLDGVRRRLAARRK
jgi:DNA polymerase (family 10)